MGITMRNLYIPLVSCMIDGMFAGNFLPGPNLQPIHDLLTESCNQPVLECAFLFVTRNESDAKSRDLLHHGKYKNKYIFHKLENNHGLNVFDDLF